MSICFVIFEVTAQEIHVKNELALMKFSVCQTVFNNGLQIPNIIKLLTLNVSHMFLPYRKINLYGSYQLIFTDGVK
jgi:hypothetical protein